MAFSVHRSSLQQSVKESTLLSLKTWFPTQNKWLSSIQVEVECLSQAEDIKYLCVLFRSEGRIDP